MSGALLAIAATLAGLLGTCKIDEDEVIDDAAAECRLIVDTAEARLEQYCAQIGAAYFQQVNAGFKSIEARLAVIEESCF